jgi:16S rRNA processing protein RimM
MDDYYYVGKILKSYGNKGQLLVYLETDDPLRYEKLESVFVEINHERIPFIISGIEFQQGSKAILKFEDVDSPTDAEPLNGLKLFLPVSFLPPLEDDQFYFHDITGFTVIDEEKGGIGKVAEILEYPSQIILRILDGKKEILVPAVDEVITGIDKENRVIHIRAPEGLIDLYL